MSMRQRTGRPLATLLFDDEDGRSLIRVSMWVDPEDLELEAEPSDREPTIPVQFRRGGKVMFGKVDRDAYRIWLTMDEPPMVQNVPMPTDNGADSQKPILRAFVR